MIRSLLPWKFACLAAAITLGAFSGAGPAPKVAPAGNGFATDARPVIARYCFECHSTNAKKGSLDLERFATVEQVRQDIKPWQQMIEQIETGEMPPKDKPQPTAEEKTRLLGWIRGFLETEAKARAGDPGHVPLRRLSNAEYDYTIRDLTGVDLKPAREFPADGAAGEGFTNAAEGLSDISPALLTKYIHASKEIAEHAVLLPDGFRFGQGKTRRDWTDESIAKLRGFYAPYGPDGKLNVAPYVIGIVRHYEILVGGQFETVAAKEKLNAKYLKHLWDTLMDISSDGMRLLSQRLKMTTIENAPALAAEFTALQNSLWRTVPIGSYRHGASSRQVPVNPPVLESHPLRVEFRPAPGQAEIVVYLHSTELVSSRGGRGVDWHQPRFEAPGKPILMLKDYAKFGPAYELDATAVFAHVEKYLAASCDLAFDGKLKLAEVARARSLDTALLKRWVALLSLDPKAAAGSDFPGKLVVPAPVTLFDTPTKNAAFPAIRGWIKKGSDLPTLMANSSDQLETIPGTVPGKSVIVHPLPKEFVAVAWKSPILGKVKIEVKVQHAHPACGNGVAWWLQHRRDGAASQLGEGTVDLGKAAKPAPFERAVSVGDSLVFAIDARDENHVCDSTQISFTITQLEKPGRVWDLSADVAPAPDKANPHGDSWSFGWGPTVAVQSPEVTVPANSVLGQWKSVALMPGKADEAGKLAAQVKSLLTTPRMPGGATADDKLYAALAAGDGPLLRGLDIKPFAKPRPAGREFGFPPEAFTPDGSIAGQSGQRFGFRLPAELFRSYTLVVDGRLLVQREDRVVRFSAGTGEYPTNHGPVVGVRGSKAVRTWETDLDHLRTLLPLYLCFPAVVPVDEVVSLKMFHREDFPLQQLFLDREAAKSLDKLWLEHTFISKQPVAENDYLPQFIGFVTQDQPKELLAYYEGMRPLFQKQADDFEKQLLAAEPKQLDGLLQFAVKAYRRPLAEKEQTDLRALYQAIRKKGAPHDEALRGVLGRVLVAPAFLFRIEKVKSGKDATAIDDWELAARLSYFLWASAPDEELRALAAAGKLRDPKVVAEQVQRMLKDPRTRALAVEFGTQWLHVRGFDTHNEKNEKLFPTFDAALKRAMDEETILFFQDLFQQGRSAAHLLDADATYLNEILAKHYGIPGVTGPQFRRVEKIRQYGRGGILGLASVQTHESGASRTSPTLRGNWISETLLGEKLPKPPADVPKISEEEAGAKLTVRQQVEMHSKAPQCAVCHIRVDPFGFALEKYDPIGRLRTKDLGGLAVDAKAKLKDGTEFEGIDGLRQYLLTKKKDVIVRLFCKKLLGYALGRQVGLSDTALLDEMVIELNKTDGTISAAVQTIVRSPQFRMVRGADGGDD